MGRFHAATTSARGGDQDAAKLLPGLSQELLRAAADAATSRQELDRVQSQTAASLEATFAAISKLAGLAASPTSTEALLAAVATTQVTSPTQAANDDMAAEIRALRQEIVQLRTDNNSGLAAVAANTGGIKRKLEDVTSASGGDAISTVQAA
jgi:DNA replication protein DnaD